MKSTVVFPGIFQAKRYLGDSRKGDDVRKRIPIIDLFAGPGGLGEGFSSLTDSTGERIFQILMSIEMESSAHKTLRLRSFFRKIYDIEDKIPQQYLDYMENPTAAQLSKLQNAFPEQWAEADREAVQATLIEGDATLVQEALKRLKGYNGPKVIIGGPPCQAYSLVGRSRRAHDPNLQKDKKQTLYKCYLQFLNAIKPDVFVMENVKGILSAQLHNEGVLGMIRADIEEAGYTIYSLVVADPQKPSDYVVKAERYGIPQARHRVILLGIRNGLDVDPAQLKRHPEETVREALAGIPSLRSDFSRRSREEVHSSWADYILKAAHHISEHCPDTELADELSEIGFDDLPTFTSDDHVRRSDIFTSLAGWYRGRLNDVKSNVLTNHSARSHMAKDLDRYLFCAAFAQVHGQPAKLKDFPTYLLPAHKNVTDSKDLRVVEFSDRFRVQMYDRPSTTVTSHISKDGHYFIHPDFRQCRSLTVREAARLQTFPDDYFFEGNRTAQYQQVGNAVPPLLANQIAKVVAQCLHIPADDYFDQLQHAWREVRIRP